jgi:UDP-N-acetylglucosamine 2-epimerase
MRIVSFVGTRPEIIKNLAFCRAAPLFPDLEFLVVHTGQNFGHDMADCFLEELEIPIARSSPVVDRSTMGSVAKDLIDHVAACIEEYAPDVIISNTDTHTALFTAYAGARLRVPVAHFEGGVRCEARLNPEEICRRLADHLSTWIFTISDDDTQSLLDEGIPAESIFMLGDLTLDALEIVLREHAIEVRRGDYNVLTAHRQENTDDPQRLRAILDGVEAAGYPTVFPIHPRTRDTLERAGLLERLERSKVITARPPQGYLDMMRLVAGCNKVISDSGGLRREGYMLDKPVISLVSFIWFKKMNRLGYELVVDNDRARLTQAIREFDPAGPRPPLFGDGRAGEYILRKILELAPRAARN